MTAPTLTVDWTTHTYTLDGRVVPSVTQVLDEASVVDWSRVDPEALLYAQQRGSAVHLACQLWDEDDLDEATLDPVVVPYLEAYRRFRDDTGFVPESIEESLADRTLMLAGTPDRIGPLNGDEAIIDLKATYGLADVTGVQLCGYRLLRQAADRRAGRTVRTPRLFGLQLRDDRTYRLREFRQPHYERVFLGALTVAHYKRGA